MRASPDDILGMAFFARVVEARSFSDAARTLGVSKSAVSARVARLEERLGVRLLHRTTRRLALTADGVRLYEICARVASQADEAAELAAGASAEPRGTLRVHAPSALGPTHLTDAIGSFVRAHPQIRIDLRTSDRVPDPTVEDVDLAIVVAGRLNDSALTVRKLASVPVAVCAAPEYLRRRGIPFRPQDLVHHDCLAHSIRPGSEDLRFQTDEGAISMTSLSRLIVDDTRVLREATLAGLGIAMMPELLVASDLTAGRLHRVLGEFQTIELAVQAIHPHGRLPPASVRAFLDHLASAFRDPLASRAGESPATVTRRPPKSKDRPVPMTEQDVRRLTAVAALYAQTEPGEVEALRGVVQRAKTMPASRVPRASITMNSRIRLRDEDGREREVSLVYPWDEGPLRISVLRPAGLALLGAAVDSAIVESRRTWRITAIPYQPEAAGDHHL